MVGCGRCVVWIQRFILAAEYADFTRMKVKELSSHTTMHRKPLTMRRGMGNQLVQATASQEVTRNQTALSRQLQINDVGSKNLTGLTGQDAIACRTRLVVGPDEK